MTRTCRLPVAHRLHGGRGGEAGTSFVEVLTASAVAVILGALSVPALTAQRGTLNAAGAARLSAAPGDAAVFGRLQRLGWFCLAVLVGTGMFQISAHPRYEGFLAITSPWASAILVKHLVIGIMVVLSAYLTWGLLPALHRMSLLRQAGKLGDTTRLDVLQRRETWLLRANLVIAVVILFLTALARTS